MSTADAVDRTLFGLILVEKKHQRRAAGIRCIECGRRGYCLRVCRRSHLRGGAAINELELRWAYVARLVFSAGARELARLATFTRSRSHLAPEVAPML